MAYKMKYGYGGFKVGDMPFYSGLFVNGGFEAGLNGWLVHGGWVVGDDTADNPGLVINDLLYQNFTLETDATYEISCDKVEGDAVIGFVVNDVDSGIDITTGAYQFIGDGQPRSFGVTVSIAGTVLNRIDNLKLIKIADANVVTYNGSAVTYNGEDVTYGVL